MLESSFRKFIWRSPWRKNCKLLVRREVFFEKQTAVQSIQWFAVEAQHQVPIFHFGIFLFLANILLKYTYSMNIHSQTPRQPLKSWAHAYCNVLCTCCNTSLGWDYHICMQYKVALHCRKACGKQCVTRKTRQYIALCGGHAKTKASSGTVHCQLAGYPGIPHITRRSDIFRIAANQWHNEIYSILKYFLMALYVCMYVCMHLFVYSCI